MPEKESEPNTEPEQKIITVRPVIWDEWDKFIKNNKMTPQVFSIMLQYVIESENLSPETRPLIAFVEYYLRTLVIPSQDMTRPEN